MKYIVILGDGMGDYPLKQFDFKTPLQFAQKPSIDYMAERGIMGTVQTVPAGMPPGSDTANLSVMGYDPAEYYSGRSPYEAASMGIKMGDKDISFRCNLVTLSDDESYFDKNMVDYSADEVTTNEAKLLIAELNRKFTFEGIRFYSGKSYRHLMIWKEGPFEWELTPPHDIIGKTISAYLPKGEGHEIIADMMIKSYDILMNHNLNKKRIKRGLKPANSIWIWGEGRRPLIPDFKTKYGLTGAVISAVDLIKGLGICAGMESIDVRGATGNLNTDYAGKVKAALKALSGGKDFVFLHIEAPDECSHRNEPENKVKAIELIDNLVVKELKDGLDNKNIDYKILFLPDHYTPLSLRTHTADPVPFLIYSRGDDSSHAGKKFSEESAEKSGLHLPAGHKLMDFFLGFPGSNYTGSDEYYIHHKVMSGESISSIAQAYSSSVLSITVENDLGSTPDVVEGQKLVVPSYIPNRLNLPPDDIDLLARLVHAEAGGEPYCGRVAVAASVINKISSPHYPNDVKGVILQIVDGHYQYSPYLDGRLWLQPNRSAYRAVMDAINGWDPSLGGLAFYNPAKTDNQWVRKQPQTIIIANHVFFKHSDS